MYTKIHKKYYDLTGFDHPGGMVALSLASGRDATELFELHHQFSDKARVAAILQKFEVKESSVIEDNNVYDWEKTLSSPFTKELKDMARNVIGNDIKASYKRFGEYGVLFIILLLQIVFFVKGYWVSAISYPVMLWVFSANVFHDATHFAISRHWRLNSLCTNAGFMLATPYHWYHQHTIGHHSFPNIIGKDPDLYHTPEAIRHAPDVPLSPAHKLQHIVFLVEQMISIPAYYLLGGSIFCILRYPYNGVVPLSSTWYLNTISILPRLLMYMILMHILPVMVHGLTIKGAVFSFLPEFIYAGCFTICSQINHLVPEATEKFDSNFFIHQVITSHNVNTSNYLTTVFTGGMSCGVLYQRRV